MPGLTRGWLAAVMLAAGLPALATAWVSLDHRPDWVMAIWVAAESDAPGVAQRDEQSIVDQIVAYVRSAKPDVSIAAGREHEYAGRRKLHRVERGLTLRAAHHEPLTAIRVATERWSWSGTQATVPQRALLASDCVFGFVLIAMLIGFATLEPPAHRDGAPRLLQPAIAVLHGITIGLLGAAAVVQHGRPFPVIVVFAALAAVPLVVWLVRAWPVWRPQPALRARYVVLVLLSAATAAGWCIRTLTGG